MDISTTGLFILFCISLSISAIFSMLETAIISADRHHLNALISSDSPLSAKARKVLYHVEKPTRFLTLVLLCYNFANILCASVGAIIVIRLLGNSDNAITINTIVVTALILIFAEIIPKTLGIKYSHKLSLFSAGPLIVVSKILKPLLWLVNGLTNIVLERVLKISKHETNERQPQEMSPEMLRAIVYNAKPFFGEAYWRSLVEFTHLSDAHVEEGMVEREHIAYIELTNDEDKILTSIKEAKHLRLLLCDNGLENCIGVVNVLTVRRNLEKKKPEESIVELLRRLNSPISTIQAKSNLILQTQSMIKARQKIALIADEFGHILGMYTEADFAKMLTRQFTPIARSDQLITFPVIIPGNFSLRNLRLRTDLALKSQRAKTLSGLIQERVEKIPDALFCLVIDGLRMEVIKTKRQHIKLVKLVEIEPPTKSEQDTDTD